MSVAYPGPTGQVASARVRPASGSTAESLILVAFILQAILYAFALGGLTYLFVFSAIHPYPYAWAAVTAGAFAFVGVILLLFTGLVLCYRRTAAGDYAGAQPWTLLLGIITIFTGLIPGILYLIGYVKLGDAIREQTAPPASAPMAAPVYGPQIACRGCGRVYPLGYYGFCPNCGQKLGA